MNRIPRSRKCAVCAAPFQPARPLQKVCGPTCSAAWAKKLAERAKAKDAREERKAHRAARERIKTRSEHMREAQAAVNAYVRERDHGKPCISCGSLPAHRYGGAIDCGHYRSTGSAPHLRFNLKNMAAQCVKCNRFLGSRTVEYRIGLIEKIGLESVEELEADQSVRKFDIEYLSRIKRIFRKKTRRARARREHEPSEARAATGG